MTSSAIVNRYANALADVILSPKSDLKPDAAVAQLRAFESIVKSSPQLRTILASPAVSTARKRTVLRQLAERAGLSRIICNFILVLTDHHRAAALSEVVDAIDVILDDRIGFERAQVRSAYELNDQQRARLSAELARIAGRQVRPRFVTDPDLIGGVTAQIGSKVYDGSVRGSLAQLRQRLSAN